MRLEVGHNRLRSLRTRARPGSQGKEESQMENVTLTQYYNQLVAAGRLNTPSFKEAAKDLAPSYAYVFLAA